MKELNYFEKYKKKMLSLNNIILKYIVINYHSLK